MQNVLMFYSPTPENICAKLKKMILNSLQLILLRSVTFGRLGGSAIECLPLDEVLILESWDPVTLLAPLEEPASPSACVSASLSVSLMNKKYNLKKKKYATLTHLLNDIAL